MYAGDHNFSLLFSLYPLINIFSFLVSIAFYILSGIGYYNMANNTGMKNSWMAWVPFCREYLLGSMADRYNANTFGKQSKLRIILTVLNAIFIPVLYIFAFVFVFSVALSFDGHYYGYYPFIPALGGLLLYCLVVFSISIAYKVFYLIAYYKTFQDFEPSNAALYTVVAFFGFGSIPLFVSRNNVPVGIAGRCDPRQPQYNVNPSNFNGFNNYNNPGQPHYQNPASNQTPPNYSATNTERCAYTPPKGNPFDNPNTPPPPPTYNPFNNPTAPPPPPQGNPFDNPNTPPPPPQGNPFDNPTAPPTPPTQPQNPTQQVVPPIPTPSPESELPKVSAAPESSYDSPEMPPKDIL